MLCSADCKLIGQKNRRVDLAFPDSFQCLTLGVNVGRCAQACCLPLAACISVTEMGWSRHVFVCRASSSEQAVGLSQQLVPCSKSNLCMIMALKHLHGQDGALSNLV